MPGREGIASRPLPQDSTHALVSSYDLAGHKLQRWAFTAEAFHRSAPLIEKDPSNNKPLAKLYLHRSHQPWNCKARRPGKNVRRARMCATKALDSLNSMVTGLKKNQRSNNDSMLKCCSIFFSFRPLQLNCSLLFNFLKRDSISLPLDVLLDPQIPL